MPEINVALSGHKFMGKAPSNAYRQVRRFFPGKKEICRQWGARGHRFARNRSGSLPERRN